MDERFPSGASRTVLLVLDCQSGVLSHYGPSEATFAARIRAVCRQARAAGCPVVFVVTQFRAGHPEVSSANTMLSGVKAAGFLVEGDPSAMIDPAVGWERGDIVVTKRRVSAFAGSDLGEILRAGGIETLALAGVATSGVVLSTVRAAADLDYRIMVLGDCCYDADPLVHAMLLERVVPLQAEVVDCAEWLATLRS